MQRQNKPQNLQGLFTSRPKSSAPPRTESLFSIGDRVKHMTFGEGTVLNVSPMGADHMYEIAFDNVGTKKLMANYVAKLMKKI